jgi:hypothetical protein
VGTLGQPRCDRAAERRARRVDLGFGVVRLDLEREVEPAGARELCEQVVENGDAGRDVRRARPVLYACTAQSSARSTIAPIARSRSSIRS